jgi:hypothetical protein
MPRKLTVNTQPISGSGARLCPERRVKAGIGATRPPETIDAADDAAVCEMLLSLSVQRGAPEACSSVRHSATPASSATIYMLNDQPILSPE